MGRLLELGGDGLGSGDELLPQPVLSPSLSPGSARWPTWHHLWSFLDQTLGACHVHDQGFVDVYCLASAWRYNCLQMRQIARVIQRSGFNLL
jgi:hypothetical protein